MPHSPRGSGLTAALPFLGAGGALLVMLAIGTFSLAGAVSAAVTGA
ncbi:hypothetical protein [Sphingomonas mali]|nr:hypothetical protein [Sphingomonas mali]